MELAAANVVKRGSSLEVVHGDDSGLIVQFYMESEHQPAKSREQGRPIFKDVPYLWIRFPGDRNREVKRRVDMRGVRGIPDPERFPRQWALFQNQQEQVQEGTPLEEFAPLSRSIALNYKGLNIFTVENLAAVPDSALSGMGHGAREHRDQAKAWLEAAKDSAATTKLAQENKVLKDEIEALKQQFKDLSDDKPKRGRPRKNAE